MMKKNLSYLFADVVHLKKVSVKYWKSQPFQKRPCLVLVVFGVMALLVGGVAYPAHAQLLEPPIAGDDYGITSNEVLAQSDILSNVGGGPASVGPAENPENQPPDIAAFDAVPSYLNVFIFEGTVTDENPGGLTVTFGGIMAGHSTTTLADGSFSYAVILDNGEEGLVTAQTVDEFGLESNIAETYVVQIF